MKKIQPILVISSIFSLLNVAMMPIFETWSGLFPEDREFMFLDVMEAFFKGYYYYRSWTAWDMWVVRLTVFIFFPSLVMLIAAIINNRILFKVSSLSGILLEGYVLLTYAIQDGLDELFNFDDGNICIGTWLAFGIFIVSFMISLNDKKERESISNNANVVVPISSCSDDMEKDTSQVTSKACYCPNCGSNIGEFNSFCGNCGFNLK